MWDPEVNWHIQRHDGDSLGSPGLVGAAPAALATYEGTFHEAQAILNQNGLGPLRLLRRLLRLLPRRLLRLLPRRLR